MIRERLPDMLEGKRILAVVPARGGSKGIPLKNLRDVAGRSLVAHAGEVVRQLPVLDRAVVSTDHDAIREAAVAAGLDAPFVRPPELSGDLIGDVQVLEHALRATEADDGKHYDVVVMLQPTSPLRRPAHVMACLRRLIAESLDSVWTVSLTDLKAHPLKQLELDAGGRMRYYDERGGSIQARQQLEPVYHRNGAAYALTRECLLSQHSLMGRQCGAVVIDETMISIDTEDDIARVEMELQRAGRQT